MKDKIPNFTKLYYNSICKLNIGRVQMLKRWTDRDWMWLVSLLIIVIIIILTWRLNDNNSVVNIISMFSSGASIMLAIVAIVQSTIYNSSANELNAKMTEKISSLENNMSLVRDKLLNDVNKVIDEAPIDAEAKAEIKDNLKNNINNEMKEKNYIYRGYLLERDFFEKIKKVYSGIYKITYNSDTNSAYNIDFKLESDERIILIELKVISNISSWRNYLKRSESTLMKAKDKIIESKEIILISAIVVNSTIDEKNLENRIDEQNVNSKVIIFTKDEIESRETTLFEEKTREYFN